MNNPIPESIELSNLKDINQPSRAVSPWIWLATGLLALIAVMAVVYAGFKLYLTQEVKKEIQQTVARIPEVERVEYSHLSVTPLPTKFEMRDVAIHLRGQPDPIRIDRVRVPHLKLADPIPAEMTAHVQGLHLFATHLQDHQVRNWCKVLGYQVMDLDIDLTYTYDPERKRVAVERMHIAAAEMGDLEIALQVGQLDLAQMVTQSSNSLYWRLAIPAVSLESLELKYRDASLASRLGKMEKGRAVHQSVQAYLTRILQPVGTDRPNARLKRNVDALLQFLQQPDILHLHAQPDKPTSLLRLMLSGGDPVSIMQLLNLSIRA